MAAERRIDLLDPYDVAQLGGIELVARGVVEGFLAGLHRSPFRGFSVEFAEHRPYQPGDELRYLDWRMLGRSDRLFVKQFEEETNLRSMMVLDVSRSMEWAGDQHRLTKLDYAKQLVAALGLILLRQRDATGLIGFDDEVRTILLVQDIETLVRLCNVTAITRANLGGVHDDDGRRRYLPYLYLRDDEVEELRSLAQRGVNVAAQDVPTARPVPLSELES